MTHIRGCHGGTISVVRGITKDLWTCRGCGASSWQDKP